MATLYIAEFKAIGQGAVSAQNSIPAFSSVPNAAIQAAQVPPTTEQTVAIGGSSAASTAFGLTTTLLRVHADTTCSIAFGTNPTAVTSNMRLAAGQTEYFGVQTGLKIAVIANT